MTEKSEDRIRAEILYNEEGMSPREIAQRVGKKKEIVKEWVGEEEESENPTKTKEWRSNVPLVELIGPTLERLDRWEVYILISIVLLLVLVAISLL